MWPLSKVWRLYGIIATAVLALLCTLIVTLGVAVMVSPLSEPVLITGNSMANTIERGSYVFVWEQSGPFEEGDILLFHTRQGYDQGGASMVHRLVEYSEPGTLQTKGDANSTIDYFQVPEEDVVGEVIFSTPPWLGYGEVGLLLIIFAIAASLYWLTRLWLLDR